MRAYNLIEVLFRRPIRSARNAAPPPWPTSYIEENLAAELAGVRTSISFSEEQLAFYKDRLKNAEDKMRDFRQGLLSMSFGQDTSSTNLQEIASVVQALDLEISSRQDQQAALRSELDRAGIDIPN